MCTVTGTVTRNAEVSVTKSGTKIVNFTLAVDYTYYDRKEEKRIKRTAYWNCHLYNSEKIAPHILKGQGMYVIGFPYPDSYTKGGETEPTSQLHVIVNDFNFVGLKPVVTQQSPKGKNNKKNKTEESKANDEAPF